MMTNKNPTTHAEEDPLAPTGLESMESLAENLGKADGEPDSQAARIAELEAELANSRDQTLRALAELENTRKRAQKDREEAGAYAISKFARDLLNVSDNLRRALEAVPVDLKDVDPRIPGLLTGVEATERELLAVFDRNGIRKIEPLDEKFDPNFHEVMFEAPVPGKAAGVVIQVVEAGYILKDRLLRAAKVGVSKAGASPGPEERLIDEQA